MEKKKQLHKNKLMRMNGFIFGQAKPTIATKDALENNFHKTFRKKVATGFLLTTSL